MIRVDNHSHIILADIADMVRSAQDKSIDRYSVTEHVSQFRPMRESVRFGSVHARGRMFESLKEYRSEFSKVEGAEFRGVRIRRGLEVDFSPRFEARIAEFVNQEGWDLLLCSVHELEDGSDIEGDKAGVTEPAAALVRWREYLKLQQKALESDFVPFSALTHPVRMSRGTKVVPDDLDDLLLDLAKIARRRGKALELNGSDLESSPEVVRRVAMASAKAGCKVSLGSDAHYPKDVFRKMENAMVLAEEFKLELV